ncbi:MAG: cytochrome c oxidase subunit II [Alteromonadaceae bacterium]|nr:MAG: cytochrome c oxidase subunit II [Alteromonadaceae bacterium]
MLSNSKRSLVLSVVVGILAVMPVLASAGEWQYNMTEGVTSISKDVYDLHMLIFYICCVIGILVFGVMFVSMFLHRKSRGAVASQFHESLTLELLWTAVPAIILIAMAFPATSTLKDMYDSDDPEIDILVTGHQWKWRYDYQGTEVSFFSNLSTPSAQIDNEQEKGQHYLLEVDEPLVIPTNTKVRFLVTAADVIHSWWVPDLAVKRDAIPGYTNAAWTYVEKEGVYRGQCAELCGKDHGFMPIEVHVVSKAKYAEWLAGKAAQAAEVKAASSKTFSFDELYSGGETLYATNCAACHGGNGEGGVGPAIKGSKIATGGITDHLDMVINGSPNNPMMAAYGEQLDPVSLAKIITFQRNAFGNNMGDSVQPLDIVTYKQGQ